MKKFFKNLCACLISVFSLISVSGCSCSKPMDVYYTINLSNEDKSQERATIGVKTTITKKFREPAGTPCYEKITTTYTFDEGYTKVTYGDNQEIAVEEGTKTVDEKKVKYKLIYVNGRAYEISDDKSNIIDRLDKTIKIGINKKRQFKLDSFSLLKNSEGVSECYNEKGEYFERATYKKAEKTILATEYPITVANGKTNFESTKYSVPKETNYSLIYQFDIDNQGTSIVNIKTFNANSILNGQLNEEGLKKVTVSIPTNNIVVIDDVEYYQLEPQGSITVTIQIKGLIQSDSVEKQSNLNLTFNLIARK